MNMNVVSFPIQSGILLCIWKFGREKQCKKIEQLQIYAIETIARFSHFMLSSRWNDLNLAKARKNLDM